MTFKHLDESERYSIQSMHRAGINCAEIGRRLNRDPSAIRRELKRNASLKGGIAVYDAKHAEKKAEHRRHKASARPWRMTPEMRTEVARRLGWGHTPEIITHCCRAEGIAMLSPEAIYISIYQDKRAGGQLYKHLPQAHKRRRKRVSGRSRRGQIPDRRPISERPAVVEERSREGDYEIDTIHGRAGGAALVTIVDRRTRRTFVRKVASLHAHVVAYAIIEALRGRTVNSITSDNGKEFALHLQIARRLKCDYFFCDPYSSWQRGSNEQVNGLIRRSFPKMTDFDEVSDVEIQMLELRLNNRPRKVLGYATPWEVASGKISLN